MNLSLRENESRMKRNMKRKSKPKRASLDTQIAKAKTFDEQKRLVMYRQAHPKTELESMVSMWAFYRYLYDRHQEREGVPLEVIHKRPDWELILEKYVRGEIAGTPNPSIPDESESLEQSYKYAKENTDFFVLRAMLHNRPEMLVALANEMKRRNKMKDWRTDFLRFAIVDSKQTGVPFNLSRLADELVENEFLQRNQPNSKAERLAFDRDKVIRRKSIYRSASRLAKRHKAEFIADPVGRKSK
jgi:hypothetical protein